MTLAPCPDPAHPAAAHPAAAPGTPATQRRRQAGRRAEWSGRAAEDAVAARYVHGGGQIVARRWRGSRGEVDLVVRDGDDLAFVEVKRARSFARAAERLSPAQIDRITGAASEFLGTRPDGQLTQMRFDLAVVDGVGRVDVLHGAFGV